MVNWRRDFMNYQKELEHIIEQVKKEDKIPTLLLHSCCGPCSSYVLEYLSNYFKITIFYYNPNMGTKEEYLKREKEQIRLLNEMTFKYPVSYLKCEYNPKEYYEKVKGLEHEKEGGLRCHKCYELRLEKTAEIAKMNNFDYFTTTLSVSPYKNAQILNELGKMLEQKYNIKYLYADFKKKEGYKRSIILSKEYQLYRQEYCGCIYSKVIK